MKPIANEKRRVVNLRDAVFDQPVAGESGTAMLQLNPHAESGVGFIYTAWRQAHLRYRINMQAPKNFTSSKAN